MNNNLPQRKRMRLQDYDYSLPGFIFVTICSNKKQCLFGEIKDGKMELSKTGEFVRDCWIEIPNHFPNIALDNWVIMPNHIHGIVEFTQISQWENYIDASSNLQKSSLSTIIGSFKSASTRLANQYQNTKGKTIWQISFYDRIIRNEKALHQIRFYIENNPAQWQHDTENPNRIK